MMKELIFAVLLVCVTTPSQAQFLKYVIADTKLPIPVRDQSAVYDGHDSVYLLGGYINTEPYNVNDILKYSLGSGTVENVGRITAFNGISVMDGEGIFHISEQSPTPNEGLNVSYYSTRTRATTVINKLPAVYMWSMASAWDTKDRVMYFFGGDRSNGGQMDSILQYNPNTNRLEQVGKLPERRSMARAVWLNGLGYIIGGHSLDSAGQHDDILQYSPATNVVTRLSSKFPFPSPPAPNSCLVNAKGQAYFVDWEGVIKFSASGNYAQADRLDIVGWPREFNGHACVYVEKLGRLYLFGGTALGDITNDISYIDFGEPADFRLPECDWNKPGLYPDHSCCEKFYYCNFGVLEKHICPDGLQFNSNTSQCEGEWRVQCEIGVHGGRQ